MRRVTTPLGFTTRQITNAYDVHEPRSGLGLLVMGLFATESSIWTPSAANFHSNRNGPSGPSTSTEHFDDGEGYIGEDFPGCLSDRDRVSP